MVIGNLIKSCGGTWFRLMSLQGKFHNEIVQKKISHKILFNSLHITIKSLFILTLHIIEKREENLLRKWKHILLPMREKLPRLENYSHFSLSCEWKTFQDIFILSHSLSLSRTKKRERKGNKSYNSVIVLSKKRHIWPSVKKNSFISTFAVHKAHKKWKIDCASCSRWVKMQWNNGKVEVVGWRRRRKVAKKFPSVHKIFLSLTHTRHRFVNKFTGISLSTLSLSPSYSRSTTERKELSW
jgi:hypothetical protein